MKIVFVLIFILPLSVSLICCGKSVEIESPEASPENTWYWGYFDGMINGQAYELKNEDFRGPVQSVRSGIFSDAENGVIPDSINIITTSIFYDDTHSIDITLYDLTEGVRFLILPAPFTWYSSSIRIEKSTPKGYLYYHPLEAEPFEVEIQQLKWISPREPVILQASLSGILYNPENPTDRITIHATYGTR